MKILSRKPQTRKEIVKYLTEHSRYDCMSSWSKVTSYSQTVKIHCLSSLTKEQQDACYDLLSLDDCHEESRVNWILEQFGVRHGYRWLIGSNGRSGGYFVLYNGERKPSQHKSHCISCGQSSFQVATPEQNQCGVCKGVQINYDPPLMEVRFLSGLGVDQGEDFGGEEWDLQSLKARRDVVWDFDQTCKRAVAAFVAYAMSHEIVDQRIMVPKTIKVSVEKKAKAS